MLWVRIIWNPLGDCKFTSVWILGLRPNCGCSDSESRFGSSGGLVVIYRVARHPCSLLLAASAERVFW